MLFDVDLTLVNTGGAGLRALDSAFEEMFDIPKVTEGVAPHGKTDPAIIREIFANTDLSLKVDSSEDEGLPGSLLDKVLKRYIFYLEREVAVSERYLVLPGITEILGELDGRSDTLMGLATGNIEIGARIKLERGALNPFFPFGGFGSDSEDRVELVQKAGKLAEELHGSPISPEDTFVIGDTPLDVSAGKAAGFQTVAVATGRSGVDSLKATNADLVIASFDCDLDQFLSFTRMR